MKIKLSFMSNSSSSSFVIAIKDEKELIKTIFFKNYPCIYEGVSRMGYLVDKEQPFVIDFIGSGHIIRNLTEFQNYLEFEYDTPKSSFTENVVCKILNNEQIDPDYNLHVGEEYLYEVLNVLKEGKICFTGFARDDIVSTLNEAMIQNILLYGALERKQIFNFRFGGKGY